MKTREGKKKHEGSFLAEGFMNGRSFGGELEALAATSSAFGQGGSRGPGASACNPLLVQVRSRSWGYLTVPAVAAIAPPTSKSLLTFLESSDGPPVTVVPVVHAVLRGNYLLLVLLLLPWKKHLARGRDGIGGQQGESHSTRLPAGPAHHSRQRRPRRRCSCIGLPSSSTTQLVPMPHIRHSETARPEIVTHRCLIVGLRQAPPSMM
ncbi:hypothetical protein LIA77_02702 [Sarocladium implicatum]|nr:hypothetical protein LIA77_02702 [Sarocladium implicatum]